jgi:8-oxo-dGTP diphosphatase
MTTENRPRVGIAVIITRGQTVLLGRRKNAHGAGSWCFPGGHLEFNEDLLACARREVAEETGLTLRQIRPVAFTNDIFAQEGKHYVTLYFQAEVEAGDPQLLEPEKCEQWAWFAWDNLPQPLFIPIQNLLKQGYNPLTVQ